MFLYIFFRVVEMLLITLSSDHSIIEPKRVERVIEIPEIEISYPYFFSINEIEISIIMDAIIPIIKIE